MVATGDRLLLVDIHRRITRPALLKRIEKRARRHQFGAGDVDEQRRRLHASQIVGADDAAGLRPEPHADGQHVGALEQSALLFATS